MKCESFDARARSDKGAIRPRAMLRSLDDVTGVWRWGRVSVPWQTHAETDGRGEPGAPMPAAVRPAGKTRDGASQLDRIEDMLRQLLARGDAAPAAAEKPFPSYDPDAPPIYVPPFPVWDDPDLPHEHERDPD